GFFNGHRAHLFSGPSPDDQKLARLWIPCAGLEGTQERGHGEVSLFLGGIYTCTLEEKELLAPPYLEPELDLEGVHPLPHPSSCASSLIQRQEKGPGDSRPPWLALPAAATGLRFLQETAERLPKAPVPEASRAEPWLEPPLPPRALAPLTAPGGPRAWDAVDSLALISLQCHRLSPPRARKQVGLGVGLGRGPGLQALAGRTLRKQPHPQRGAEGLEPGFQGAVLRMHLKPDQEGHQLLITAQFSSACGSRSWGASTSLMGASTSNHQDPPGSRSCASCRTQRTPLWRDAEDGTPLCNACGIRYKKYGIRCPACWTVPRKSICPLGHCTRCGAWLCTSQGPGRRGTEGHDSSIRPRVPRLHGEKEKSFPREVALRAGEGLGIPSGQGHSPEQMWIPAPVARPEQ
ncbi:GATA-type zinc finger protein 1, partial [Dromiciops gliroides]|uniref:GATA-type zinc finger protein 1 n=1 Tax=Dromiciops gliroides TaxID=33562 RepID=UPI001CC59239